MNRFLAGCGIVALVVVGAIASLAVFAWLQFKEAEPQARKAARDAIVATVTTWNEDALLARSTDELRSPAKRPEVDKIFAIYRRLGTFKSLGEPTSNIKFKSFAGNEFRGSTAEYSFPATFSAGSATIRVRMRKLAAGWRIFNFRIDSDALVR
jgi:hypothetical protein